MSQTTIQLYRCFGCGGQVYWKHIEKGEGCQNCTSLKVRPAAPTPWLIFQWFLHNPSQILVFLKENILGR